MVRSIYITLLLYVVVAYSYAQELPEIIPPSPTVANLMSFEEVPVDTYTGQPDISIPLYSKTIGNNMAVNAILKYHTSGVRIDNISGWTGTGWSLDIGGVISRTVRGTPDEEALGGSRLGVFHNDEFWNYDHLSDNGEFHWNILKSNGNTTYDSQPDLYQFSLFGTSGRFVIVKENGILVPKLLSRDQRVKIELVDYDSNYSINSFTIIDAYGYRYTFDVIESVVSTSFGGSIPQGQSSGVINGSASTNVISNRSAWHLSKVSTSNLEELVSISYQAKSHTYVTSMTTTTNEIITPSSNLTELKKNSYNQGIMEPKKAITYYQSQMNSQKPAIVHFKDGTTMEFITQGVHPENAGEILREVILKNNDGTENKRFNLVYETTVNNNRLWLTSVTETGGNIALQTTLSYNNKEDLPIFNSKSDIWGYNMGITEEQNCSSGFGSYNPTHITTGLLKEIVYPTGGRKEFIFEHNTVSYVGALETTDNDHLTDPANNTIGFVSQNFQATIDNQGNPNGIPLPRAFTIAQEQEVYINSSGSGIVLSNNNGGGFSGEQNDPEDQFRIVLANDLVSFNGFGNHIAVVELGDCISMVLPAGNYLFGLKPFPLNTTSVQVNGSASLEYLEPNNTINPYILGGGPRIKEINFYTDTFNDSEPKRTFSYDYSDSDNPAKSSGVMDSNLGNLSRNYEVLVKRHLFSSRDNTGGALIPTDLRYRVKTKGPNAQMTKGGYVGYRSVKVYQNGNGYTRFNYTSPYEYPSPPINFQFPFVSTPNIDFKHGLMISQQVYNENGDILKEVINDPYDFQETAIALSINVYDNKTCPWTQFYNTYQEYISLVPGQGVAPDCSGSPCITYSNCGTAPFQAHNNMLTDGWARLTGVQTKDYFYDNQNNQSVVEQRQTFEYNEENFRQSAVNTFIVENGVEEYYRTETFFPIGSDLNNYAGDFADILKMRNLNILDLPVYTRSLKDNELLSELHSIYDEKHQNRMDLVQVLSKKADLLLEDRVIYKNYDSYGNPTEVSQESGPPISYLWGYNGTYPLAKIENATYTEVLATGVDIEVLKNPNSSSVSKKTELDKIRLGLPTALITTFLYDPLVGIIESIDPKGYMTKYTYDDLNRLIEIRDANGKLISENVYHYKNQD